MSNVLTSISIRLKVILAFAVVLCCTIGLGVFSLVRLEGVNAAAAEISANALPTTRVLGELSYHTMRFRQLEATYALTVDPAAKAQEAASMQRVAGDAEKALRDFEPSATTSEERSLNDQMKRGWQAYLAMDRKFLAISDPVSAAELYRGEMRTLFNKFQDASQAAVAFNANEAKDGVDLGAALGSSARSWILVVLGLTALLCAAIGWSMISAISKPIGAMTGAMLRLAENDLDVQVYGAERGDEIGSMAKALEVFKSNAIERARLTAEQKAQEERASQVKHDALVGMAEAIERETTIALENIGARTSAMAATAEEMNGSASRTGASAGGAAAAATQALANAQTVASAAEELAASIREIGSQVGQSSTVVGRAVEAGSDTRRTIEALNEKVERIGAVADMIGEIAAKTNLLALNATIEAARAGDAGKGFAVVASEVKALATQTARSTEEISRHIAEVRSATEASVSSVVRIEQTITEINSIAGSIAAAVEEQGAATAEIARNVTDTAAGVNEMTRRINEVSAEAEKTGGQADKVLNDTKALNRAVVELKHSVTRAVRTSTADVDRRHDPRFQEDLTTSLGIAGHGSLSVRVADISAHGACVRGAPEVPVGARGTLGPDGIGMALPISVREVEDGALHVAFELDAAAQNRFQPILERLAPKKVA